MINKELHVKGNYQQFSNQQPSSLLININKIVSFSLLFLLLLVVTSPVESRRNLLEIKLELFNNLRVCGLVCEKKKIITGDDLIFFLLM